MYERQCEGCQKPFSTSRFTQKKCQPHCGRTGSRNQARSKARLANDVDFVGVDGEGVDRPDGRHEYVMLSVGTETLWENGNALSLGSILSFLYEQYTKQPNAIYVGFFLGYDFIQWEKLLPEDRARLLLTTPGIESRKTRRNGNPNPYPDPVVWGEWELDIMAGRRFKLRPHSHIRSQYSDHCRNRTCQAEISSEDIEIRAGEVEWQVDDNNMGEPFKGTAKAFWKRFSPTKRSMKQGWMYICDTGPFWQTSFLNVINPGSWEGVEPVCTDDEYQLVKKGKADRGTIADYSSTDYFEEMRRYNILENDILARVTDRLNKGFMNERIPIKIGRTDWYGPGRAAQLWMDQLHKLVADPMAVSSNRSMAVGTDPRRRTNETGLLSVDCFESVPSWFREAAQSSYYGGWFEQFAHGHVGDLWEYDINSAYPFIISTLPCLHTTGNHNGRYERGYGSVPGDNLAERSLCLVYADIHGSNPYIGAMPHRDRTGRIARPHHVKGWYWLHEIESSQRAGLVDSVEVAEWCIYHPCNCCRPFNPDRVGIESLYQLRLDFGKNTPQGKSSKLVYNSAYGKTAQSIGEPKYSNPIYASLITAGCRSLILDAIATHPTGPSAVTMVATDGIYFLERHPTLNLSKTKLGAWDETFKPNTTQLMPGIYWDDNTRNAIGIGKAPKLKSRGIAAQDLAKEIERLDYLFALSHQKLAEGGTYEWPEVEFLVRFQLESAKSALNRGKWELAGKVSHESIRRISANPSSKRHPLAYRDVQTFGITRTRPYRLLEPYESVPYDKSFGYRSEDPLHGTDATVDRNGADPLQYWRDLINNGNIA